MAGLSAGIRGTVRERYAKAAGDPGAAPSGMPAPGTRAQNA
jgi:hypothetical protein